jgi:hypothetical protein
VGREAGGNGLLGGVHHQQPATPKRSASMPKLLVKKVGMSGCMTWPPSASASNHLRASASVDAVIDSMIPLNSALPEHWPSESMSSVSPTRTTECITLSGPGVAPAQLASVLPSNASAGASL